MINTLQDMEKARQEMKRQAFLVELEGRGFNFTDKSHDEFGFNDEILNMVWEMWQAAQEQMLREQAEEAAQPNAFLSAVSDVAMKLSSGDYALVPKEIPWTKADDLASAEWDKHKELFLSEHRDMTAFQVEESRLRWCRNKAHQLMDQYKTIIASANK